MNKESYFRAHEARAAFLLDFEPRMFFRSKKEALVMEIRDIMTGGQNAIPVVLASGNQRFRIAISIALAMGKYIQRESRRVESVIIDEGFGSLDKTGREDTIQELRSLQQHLEPIVLVPHQEEFYKTFQTDYTIYIVNGASQASLVNNRCMRSFQYSRKVHFHFRKNADR